MNTAMSQEILEKVFDQVTREIIQKVAGIRLYQGDSAPGKEICTVYAPFAKGFNSALSLCGDVSMFTRLTQNIMQVDEVTSQDVEDFTIEFFNVLCGNIASRLFQATKIASRFEIPTFHRGRYRPQDFQDQFVINYFSDQNEGVQLIHHTP